MKGVWVRHPAEGAPVVVFVHGVLSSGEKGWKHPGGGFWPAIVADDPKLQDVGVYVFDYKTGFFSGNYSLGDAVDALKEHLKFDSVATTSGIVFVCHSMGGIVVRRFLVSRAVELIDRDIPVAIFLVASPSLGSDYANLAAPLARRFSHSQAAALRFSQSNTWLNDLDRDFINMREQRRLRLAGKELVEDQSIVMRRWWRKQIVEPFSGARYFGDPIKIPDSDHFSIAKIPDGDALQHSLLRQFIIDWRASLEPADAGGPPAITDGGAATALPSALEVEVSFVLNLSVDVRPDDADGLDRLQDAIRTATGSPLVTIVEARPGSLLLFVSDPDGALARIEPDVLRERLLALAGAELVGLVPAETYAARGERVRELAAASTELLAWPTALPDGERLERPELTRLTQRISGDASSTTAVIGAAGSGKSALLATLARAHLDVGWPVLAIKADLIEPDVVSEEMLRERLGLRRTPSETLRELAGLGPVLLVIDQLDALAGHLDIKTLRLSVLLNLVRAIGGLDNVHIVLSSRPFEFEHDVRLRGARAESLQLELPSWEEVLAVLDTHGVAAAGWPADAREVMRSPQALATYLQLDTRPNGQPFASYQLMLERLWTERVLEGGHGGALDRLASDVAEAMAEQESLWLATVRFADRSAELLALVAAGVLKTMDASVGFSHQTLFEFALARSQAREPGLLSRLARDRQSSLFLRPKLWAALTYLRGADRDLYHGELETIWGLDLRPHLRALLIDFLGSQGDPTDREAILMDAAFTGEQTQLRAFKAVTGSAGWFERLAETRVAAAMTDEERLANAQVAVLTEALRTAPDKVTGLVRQRWVPEPANDVRAWAVIQWSSPWTEDALAIAKTVIARTDIAIATIDHQAAAGAVEQPGAALRLVRAKLDSDLDRAALKKRAEEEARQEGGDGDDGGVERRLLDRVRDPVRDMVERGDDWDSLAGIAETWPVEVIGALWPWFMRALAELERTASRDRYVGYTLGHEADFRFQGENNLGLLEGAVLGALRVAVEGMVDRDPDAFRRWVTENDAVALAPVQRLIAHGIAHRPQTFAAEGLAFATGDERRYFLGSIHDIHGTIKRMVAAVSPFWSPAQLETFERRVREFAPPAPAEKTDPKERMGWRHMVRQTQLDLLRALPKNRRSEAAERQVQEGERRYGTRQRGVSFGGPQAIGSIIEAGGMARASDDDIVNAFIGLPDAVGWDNPRRRMAGGNVQLARAFAEFAKVDAVRAMRILKRLDASNGVRAAAYALDALAEAGDADSVTSIARDVVARDFDSEELRNSTARALSNLANRGKPVVDDLVGQLERWLDASLPEDVEGESPPVDQAADRGDADDPAAAGGDEEASADTEAGMKRSPLWGHGVGGGYPGGSLPVADALVHIRLSRGEADEAAATLSRFLEREKGTRQWEALSRHLLRLDGASGNAGELLIETVLAKVPGVVGSRRFAQFVAEAQRVHHGTVERHLDAWRNGDGIEARQAYGEIVALDALLHPDRDDSRRRLDELTDGGGTAAAQVGAALTAAHLLAEEPDRRLEASRALVALLALPNAAVWPAAFEFFRLADRLVPDEGTVAFLRAVAEGVHRSGSIDPTFVVDGLATMLPHEAALVGQIALALTEKWKAELADVRTATARATSSLVDLAITLHRLGPQTRNIGLEIFEQLVDIDAYEARQTLNEIDGRFLETAPRARRPRLRRRSQVLPRRNRTVSGG